MRRMNRRRTSAPLAAPLTARLTAPLAASVAVLAASMLTVAAVSPASAQEGDGHTAVINGAVRHQVITGFGASEAFGQAETVMNAPAAVQQQALGLLYNPASGAGLTVLRNEISADQGSAIEPAARPAPPPPRPICRSRPSTPIRASSGSPSGSGPTTGSATCSPTRGARPRS